MGMISTVLCLQQGSPTNLQLHNLDGTKHREAVFSMQIIGKLVLLLIIPLICGKAVTGLFVYCGEYRVLPFQI